MTKYIYTKKVSSDRLTQEIQVSSIVTALNYMDTYSMNGVDYYVDIYFKADLSLDDKRTLDSIIEAHSGIPLPVDNVTVISSVVDESNRPCVRSDSRDEHDTTYFTTVPDKWTDVVGENIGTGDGNTTIFYLNDKEVKSVKIYFNGILQTSGYSVNYTTYNDFGTITQYGTGKVVFTTAPVNGVAITASYSYATIGSDFDNELTFDFATDSSPKVIMFGFCDPVHIKDGVIYYLNGANDATINVEVVCPAGDYYLDNSGQIHLASLDTVVQRYVINHILSGNADMGHYFDVEARSKAIPKNYKLKFTINKGSATTLSGSLRLEINRERTIIL